MVLATGLALWPTLLPYCEPRVLSNASECADCIAVKYVAKGISVGFRISIPQAISYLISFIISKGGITIAICTVCWPASYASKSSRCVGTFNSFATVSMKSSIAICVEKICIFATAFHSRWSFGRRCSVAGHTGRSPESLPASCIVDIPIAVLFCVLRWLSIDGALVVCASGEYWSLRSKPLSNETLTLGVSQGRGTSRQVSVPLLCSL